MAEHSQIQIHNVCYSDFEFETKLQNICTTISNSGDPLDNEQFYLNELYEFVKTNTIVFGSQILLNEGKNKTLGACTILPLNKNTRSEITKLVDNGLGFGFSLDHEPLPTVVLDEINLQLKQMDGLSDRRVAAIATLDISHPDILEFITHKRNANFFDWRINLSATIPNFYFDNIEVSVPNKVISEIASAIHYCGEPGILFIDRINDANPTPQIKYECVAPCAEIAMSLGEQCLFSYINLEKLVEKGEFNYDKLIRTVTAITTALDRLIDISYTSDSNEIVKNKRRIGIGVCGYAAALIKLRYVYGSPECLEFTNNVLSMINYYSKETSIELAKKCGAFPLFECSLLTNFDWFMAHGKGVSTKVTRNMWYQQWKRMCKYGIRNCATTALPPTGNSALLANTTFSIEPLFHLNYPFVNEALSILCEEIVFSPTPTLVHQLLQKLSPHNQLLFRTANEIPYLEQLQVLSICQQNIDEAISKTVNIPNTASIDDVKNILLQAYRLGLKGITIFRDGCLSERTEEQP